MNSGPGFETLSAWTVRLVLCHCLLMLELYCIAWLRCLHNAKHCLCSIALLVVNRSMWTVDCQCAVVPNFLVLGSIGFLDWLFYQHMTVVDCSMINVFHNRFEYVKLFYYQTTVNWYHGLKVSKNHNHFIKPGFRHCKLFHYFVEFLHRFLVGFTQQVLIRADILSLHLC